MGFSSEKTEEISTCCRELPLPLAGCEVYFTEAKGNIERKNDPLTLHPQIHLTLKSTNMTMGGRERI